MRIAWFAPDTGNSVSSYFTNLILRKLKEKFEVVHYSASPSNVLNNMRFLVLSIFIFFFFTKHLYSFDYGIIIINIVNKILL